jgi:hypothetical protein
MIEKTGRFLTVAAALLLTGVIIQAWLGSRGGIGGDQYVLFDLGLDYLEEGRLSAVGKGMSGGGFIPGSLLQLLIGVPFSVWRDYRSPVVLIGLFHLLAAVVSTLAVRRAAGPRAALFFLTLWWLSPWRLYHSGILWEPAYVVLPAALHLAACWGLRERAGALWTALLVGTLVLTFQLHGSFLFLVVLTGVLFLRKVIRLQWKGGLLGAAVGGVTLIPTMAAFFAGTLPSPAPSNSFIGYGLVTVAPLIKSFVYWFRLGSLDIGRRLKGVVFLDEGWAGAGSLSLFAKGAAAALVLLASASILIAVAAHLQRSLTRHHPVLARADRAAGGLPPCGPVARRSVASRKGLASLGADSFPGPAGAADDRDGDGARGVPARPEHRVETPGASENAPAQIDGDGHRLCDRRRVETAGKARR